LLTIPTPNCGGRSEYSLRSIAKRRARSCGRQILLGSTVLDDRPILSVTGNRPKVWIEIMA
jgi:hypothetical protein